jgi:outer membrane protein OmpA-like peptidoglycan-associated protein
MRRRSNALVALAACSLGLVSRPVLGQLDTERMKPAVTHDGWVNAEGSGLRGRDDPWEFGAWLNYGVNPLVIVDRDGNLTRQLEAGRLGMDLYASVTLAKPFGLGLDVPFFLGQSGDQNPSFAGLGDLRLVPKLELVNDRAHGIGLALAAELRAPTHSGDYSGGARNVGFFPKAVLDHRSISGIRLGFNVGVLVREGTDYGNVKEGSEFAYAAAVGYRFGGIEGRTELGVEVLGAVGLREQDREEVPLELFGFLRHAFNEEWEITGGPAVGILSGYGVPTVRGFVGLRFTPTSHDRDHDGIGDSEDRCPDVAEDRDGDQDDDGCPEEDLDSDHDGVPDSRDRCPNAKETINGIDDDDGCPDTGDPRVIYQEGELKILDAVQFKHGSAEITPDSYSLLDQVALTMKANPDVKRIRVEGHTDDTGPEDINQRLSQQRAEAVRRYIIHKGVNPDRLTAKGYGESRPRESGTSDQARARNRRVQFVIED